MLTLFLNNLVLIPTIFQIHKLIGSDNVGKRIFFSIIYQFAF